jgi:hypothetical protein
MRIFGALIHFPVENKRSGYALSPPPMAQSAFSEVVR